jgi:hypothetical protein
MDKASKLYRKDFRDEACRVGGFDGQVRAWGVRMVLVGC